MSTILKVQDMNVYYGAIHAIKGISFEVNEGEVVTLIGANGSGKTTTLQTISGLLRSKTGSIEFLGENISHVPAHKLVERGLVQVPEDRRIFLQMTVQENLEMGAYTRSALGASGIAKELDATGDKGELGELAEARFKPLSRQQVRRISDRTFDIFAIPTIVRAIQADAGKARADDENSYKIDIGI